MWWDIVQHRVITQPSGLLRIPLISIPQLDASSFGIKKKIMLTGPSSRFGGFLK